MENCKMSGKSQGILKWMISGNTVAPLNIKLLKVFVCPVFICSCIKNNLQMKLLKGMSGLSKNSNCDLDLCLKM